MYNVLIENGYKPSQIKVLVSDGLEPLKTVISQTRGRCMISSPLDLTYPADGANEVNAAATAQNVKDYLDKYKSTGSTPLTSTKSLFIFTTGHGSKISGTTKDTNQVNLNLWNNEALSDAEFVAKLTAIQSREHHYGNGAM